MMMAQPYPTGMGPGHPGMPHGHPMGGVPHPGGHMAGQPGPGMMPGMHPGVSGPQVTQGGPMTAGMPLGAGGSQVPMQNGMAMAHLGQQQHMFQQANPQMNLGQMQQANQAMMRQQMMMRQAQAAQGGGMPMNMANNPQFQQHLAQMKMGGMPMQPHHFQQMQASHIQQQQHQQRMLQQHQAQQAQQQQAQQQAQQQQHQQHQQAQQQAALRNQQAQAIASQQMQMSRSNPEPTSQPPQPQPTPAPQHQPPPPQPTPANQPQQQPAQQTPKPQPTPQQTQQQGTPQPQVKQDGPEEDTPIKQQEMANPMLMQDIKPQQPQENFTGQCILQLLLYQDQLANPDRPNDLGYWEETIQKYFSPFGSIRQQLYNNKMGNDKSFQLQYPSLARFYYSHYTSGIKQILMQSFDHNQSKLPNGGIHIWSNRASLTYVFHNDLRVTTQGSLKVSFDEMQKIEHLFIATSGWTEYIPRHALHPASPEQKASPKLNKNAKKNQQKTGGPSNSSPVIPASVVNDFGLPSFIVQFLEVAEVMTAMGPLMEYYHTNPGISPREALMRINNDNSQMNANMMRMQQNANMAVANGQVPFQQQRAMAGMMPNQLQSPALQHLGLPHGQVSPHMGGPNHTPSPAQNPAQGGVAMMHQMSAQGSNLSGSQGPSTNTSPNVSNKRRRASQIKMEDENSQQEGNGNGNKVKPSPRMGGKRQKGQS